MSARAEVCFLVGRGDVVLWSDRSDSPTAMPDRRARWEAIWRWREELVLIAHSHPVGPLEASHEDLETAQAVEDGLGRELGWVIVAPEGSILVGAEGWFRLEDEPWWTSLLRDVSGMNEG